MVKYNEWITDAWKLFSAQWVSWIVVILITMAAGGLAAGLFLVSMMGFSAMLTAALGTTPVMNFPLTVSVPVATTLFLVSSLILLLISPLTGGLYIAAFNQMRTGVLEISDIFKGYKHFWQLNFYLGVVGGLIMLGFMMCVLPGFYLAVCAMFAIPLIVEKRLGFWDAFKKSSEMVKRDFWGFLLFALLAGIIGSLGSYVFGILIVVTYPLNILMHAVAVRDTFGVDGAVYPPPAPPPYYYQPQPGQYSPPPPQYYPPQQQPQPPAPQAAFCPSCGNPLAPGDFFCVRCGSKIQG